MKQIAAFLLLALAGLSHAESLSGRVVGVLDGDTIELLDEVKRTHRVRLSGIDAPEKKQPFGQRSKQSLSELTFGKPAVIEYSKRDHYGRLLGKVLIDGKDANQAQLERGMAWMYRRYERELAAQDRALYSRAEELARTQKLGLWADKDPVPPWDFRR